MLESVAFLVVLISGGAILASLYNTMGERRLEIAILRSLGASRPLIFAAVVAESSSIAFIGSLLGFLVHAALVVVATDVIRSRTGVVLEVWVFHPAYLWTPLGMVLLGALAGVAPAWKAYATDVASHLVPLS